MEATDRFETLVGNARQTVHKLASHDPAYESSLQSGIVSARMNAAVTYAFTQLRAALDQLAFEISRRSGLSDLPGPPRFPVGTGESFHLLLETCLPGLMAKRPDVAKELLNLQTLSESDGWLQAFVAVADHLEELQLRRAIGRATLSRTTDGGMQLTLTSETGECIPSFAPVWIDGIVDIESGSGKAFYLTIGPDDREIASFLDRCIRGIEHLGKRARTALDTLES
jgi:hypothetical protein